MQIYLDNAATTVTIQEAIDRMTIILSKAYGNPSSLHKKGMEAEKIIIDAKETIAKYLGVDKKEIIFTSGGTEANNLALLGIARAYVRSGDHIIISDTEHASISQAAKQLEEEGYKITRIAVDRDGRLDLDQLASAVTEATILVSVMHINNEVGNINPIDEIGEIVKKKNPNTLFHVDGVQSFGKYLFYPRKSLVDTFSMSGHKIHGPKGIGALYIRSGIKIKPILYGGGHQLGLRPGTENTPGIGGFATAVDYMAQNLDDHREKVSKLKILLKDGILSTIEGTYINGLQSDEAAYHILNVGFEGIRSEVLLHALESKGIFVSNGAACSSNKPSPSATLISMGRSVEEAGNAIRFSFSCINSREDIEYCLKELQEIVPTLRKYIRKK